MLFIIVWKVVRLLVILKNITSGSKSLQLVQNVVFYSLPGLMLYIIKFPIYAQLGKVLYTLDFYDKLRDQRE